MGTSRLPDQKSEAGKEGIQIEDAPRVGAITWVLLAAMLLPPALVTFIDRLGINVPHQRLWVILLGIPIFLIILSLPRKYLLDERRLSIVGLWYKLRVPLENIRSVSPTTAGEALVYPGSIFCTDPSRAIKIVRQKGITLVISPRAPEPFLKIRPVAEPGEGSNT